MQRRLRFARLARFPLIGLALLASGCGSSSTEGSFGNGGNGAGGSGDGGAGGGGVGADGGPSSGDAAPSGPAAMTAIPLSACVPLVYAANVSIGGQDFQLIVDTGSTSLGVAGSGCSNCSVTPLYAPGSTATDQKQTASSQFGSGSFSGEIYKDSVGLAPSPGVAMDFVSITSQTGFFQAGSTCGGKPYQGLVGFDRAAAALQGTNAFFDQAVASQGFVDVFAMQLCDDGGTLWLGGFDAAATTAAPQYTPFTSDPASTYYYTVDLASISVDGASGSVAVASGTYNDSILDTGTSAFLLGSTAYTQLTGMLSANAGFKSVFGAQASTWFNSTGGNPSCANLTQTKAQLDAALPAITMTFGSNPGITVKAPATESYLMPYPGAGWCNALLSQAQGPSFPIAAILGAPVLRSNVVIFDRAHGRAGFAPHAPCPTSAKAKAPEGPVVVQHRIGYPGIR
jgi:hypothetical protein